MYNQLTIAGIVTAINNSQSPLTTKERHREKFERERSIEAKIADKLKRPTV